MRREKSSGAAAAVTLAVLVCACGITAGATRRFQESDVPVLNPDCGWVAYNYEDSYAFRRRAAGGGEPFRFASVVYTRHPMKEWYNDEGGFEGTPPLRLLRDWMSHERHVAFRVYANDMQDLPAELQRSLSPLEGPGGDPGSAIEYWDDAYLAAHARLVRWLGAELGSSPYLAYVDIGGVGNTGGEWHFAPVERYRRAGLDDETMYALVDSLVNVYREAFPDTRLFIGYDCIGHSGYRRGDVVKLLRENGVGLRDDGLGGWPYPQHSPSISQWPVSGLWRRVPVLFEGGGEGGGVYGWGLQGLDRRAVLDWVIDRAPPTYINIGGAESTSARACEQLSELLAEYGRRVGYRFVLLEARYPERVAPGQPVSVAMRWANRGAAPCYAERELELAFCAESGETVRTVAALPEPRTREWPVGREFSVELPLQVPFGLPEADYTLKLRMLFGDPRAPGEHVRLATEGADELGRYELGRIRVTLDGD